MLFLEQNHASERCATGPTQPQRSHHRTGARSTGIDPRGQQLPLPPRSQVYAINPVQASKICFLGWQLECGRFVIIEALSLWGVKGLGGGLEESTTRSSAALPLDSLLAWAISSKQMN